MIEVPEIKLVGRFSQAGCGGGETILAIWHAILHTYENGNCDRAFEDQESCMCNL